MRHEHLVSHDSDWFIFIAIPHSLITSSVGHCHGSFYQLIAINQNDSNLAVKGPFTPAVHIPRTKEMDQKVQLCPTVGISAGWSCWTTIFVHHSTSLPRWRDVGRAPNRSLPTSSFAPRSSRHAPRAQIIDFCLGAESCANLGIPPLPQDQYPRNVNDGGCKYT